MKALKLLLIFLTIMMVPGCEKQDDKILRGNIVGFVKIYDDQGIEFEDHSGVTVQIESTSYSATTNKAGRFEFSNIPAGTYILVYHKDGFGDYKRFNFQFIGGNVPHLCIETGLYMKPATEIKTIESSFIDGWLHLSGTITETSRYSILIYLSDSPDVSNVKYDYLSYMGFCCVPVTEFNQDMWVNYRTFAKGETIYMVIYMKNPFESNGYQDYDNDGYYYTSAKKASEVIQLTIE